MVSENPLCENRNDFGSDREGRNSPLGFCQPGQSDLFITISTYPRHRLSTPLPAKMFLTC